MTALAFQPSLAPRSSLAPLNEPHPITRLRERYGVGIGTDQLRALERLISCRASRWNTSKLRFVQRSDVKPDTFWLVNLATVLGGRDRWALCIFDEIYDRIRTFLPNPETNNPRRVVILLTKHNGRIPLARQAVGE